MGYLQARQRLDSFHANKGNLVTNPKQQCRLQALPQLIVDFCIFIQVP
jgi:hypothetical protein